MNQKHPQPMITPVNMGEIHVSLTDILEANISTCVTVCLIHYETGIGGMTHISKAWSHTPDWEKRNNYDYRYARFAVPALVKEIKQHHPGLENRKLSLVISGGLNDDPPLVETLEELGLKKTSSGDLRTTHDSKYRFKLRGWDINHNLYRKVVMNPVFRNITIYRHDPFDFDQDKGSITFQL